MMIRMIPEKYLKLTLFIKGKHVRACGKTFCKRQRNEELSENILKREIKKK
jgi:hypothetical protein